MAARAWLTAVIECRRLLCKAAEFWEDSMWLVIYYVVFMIAGDIVAYLVGLGIEREWGSVASLWVFLGMYFLSLWVAWLLAVWMTKPKAGLAAAGSPPTT